jgi:general secretion pathway protein G
MNEQGAGSMEWGARDGAAIGSRQFSARMRSGPRFFLTRHSSPGRFHFVRRAGGGFTLIELMATVAIVVIIAGLTLGTLGYVNRKGAESRAKSEVAAISAAIDSYKLDFGSFPEEGATELYKELTGQGTINQNKVYIEPTPSMVTDTANGPFLDPWGTPYNYRNPGTENVGFFDFWTTCGGEADQAKWIRN